MLQNWRLNTFWNWLVNLFVIIDISGLFSVVLKNPYSYHPSLDSLSFLCYTILLLTAYLSYVTPFFSWQLIFPMLHHSSLDRLSFLCYTILLLTAYLSYVTPFFSWQLIFPMLHHSSLDSLSFLCYTILTSHSLSNVVFNFCIITLI